MQDSSSQSPDTERAELAVVLDALASNPRLANLLQFLADRYFQGKTAEITEFNIATEVFGRSKKAFDGSTDSIARVEAHRLRKRLKEYYEEEGREHDILISLPYRSYVPAFIHRSTSAAVPGIPEVHAQARERADLSAETESAGLRIFRERAWVFTFAAIAVVLLASYGTFRLVSRHNSGNSRQTASAPRPDTNQSPTPANAAHAPIRLLAGYEGSPRVDSAGASWEADRYFSSGTPLQRPGALVAGTSDPMLFEHWRTGDFSYNIPLAPGPYELHLYFVASPQDDPKSSFFKVSANGTSLLEAFNIGLDVLGPNIADERVFKDIYPDKDGVLHLQFAMDRTAPLLNALEILPGLPHRQLPVRLVTQRAAVTDQSGNLWRPDNYFQGGMLSDPPRLVSGTPDPNLYAQERYGHFTYSIPVDTHGRYTLVLHFAELYWVPDPNHAIGVGNRIFRVYCNGSTLLDNFDIYKEVGSMHALTKMFHHLQPSTEGKLDLTFEPIVNYGTISAIEVIDESE
jgi:hypothetical protein